MATGMELFTGASIIGLLAAGWKKIQVLLFKLYSLVFVNVDITGVAATGLIGLCNSKFKRLRWGKLVYNSDRHYVKPVDKQIGVAYEMLVSSDPQVFFVGKHVPVILKVLSNNGSGSDAPAVTSNVSGPPSGNGLSLTFLRGTVDIDALVIESTEFYNNLIYKQDDRRRFFIRKLYGTVGMHQDGRLREERAFPAESKQLSPTFIGHDVRLLKWKATDVGYGSEEVKPAQEVLILSDEVKKLHLSIQKWVKSRDWYKKKNIPWKRGALFYGKPGTGKTSYVRAIGEEFDLPIFVFYIATLSDTEFAREWAGMLSYAPCIALIEDIDTVFEKRVNIAAKFNQGLTFECLLNCIDGVEKSDGVLTVITTNNIEKLDEALGTPRTDHVNGSRISTRPGRIDMAIKLEEFTHEQREVMAKRILCDCPEFIDEIVKKGDGDTPAQFQERCAQLALTEFWKSQHG